MTTSKPELTAEEVARRGKDLYGRTIRPLVEADHQRQVVAIDVHTGAYAIGETAVDAAARLREHCPDAEVWLERVGAPTYRRGGPRVRIARQ